MLYNTRLKKVKTIDDCFTCPSFDSKTKTCNGLNRICYEYEEKTMTIIDGKTKLPRKV